MKIFSNPTESAVKKLLSDSGLPTEDIAAEHLEHFFHALATPEHRDEKLLKPSKAPRHFQYVNNTKLMIKNFRNYKQ
ncbi:MAG: hypothetical protein GY786_20630 [Proteobacteria bacterium]|nr:hypothetical protein [Pseudomonadota bacterium]